MVTQELLHKLFRYEPETGNFIRLVATSNSIHIGDVAGCLSGGYITISVLNRKRMAHRLVWIYMYGKYPPECIDHINGDRADNRLVNLREATYQENNRNMGIKPRNKCGYKGVYFNKSLNKFIAQCTIKSGVKYLGCYKTAEEASVVYEAFSKLHFKEFYREPI